MALKIRGRRIIAEEVQVGVRFDDGYVVVCEDEEEARMLRAMTSGDVVECDVYVSEWRVMSDPAVEDDEDGE